MSRYTEILDDIVKTIIDECSKPNAVMTEDIASVVRERWIYSNILITNCKIGRSMARLGYRRFRTNTAKGWFI